MTLAAPAVDLSGDRRRLRRERRVRTFFWIAGLSTLAISIAIVASLIGNSITFLSHVDLGTLWTTDKWAPRVGKYDLATLFMGSLLVTGVAMLIAAPLGLGAAISSRAS